MTTDKQIEAAQAAYRTHVAEHGVEGSTEAMLAALEAANRAAWEPIESAPNEFQRGMTLRDYFAGQAMTGWLASYGPEDGRPGPEESAKFFYSLADAMIAERERRNAKL